MYRHGLQRPALKISGDHLCQWPGFHTQPRLVSFQCPSIQRRPAKGGSAQYPSVYTYWPPRHTYSPPTHTCLGEGAMGLTLITGAAGRILTTN
jgi:hypothetical protein